MTQYIKEPKLVEKNEYQLNFYQIITNSICYGFDCDENGNVLLNKLNPAALDNYNKVANDPNFYARIDKFDCSYFDKGTIKCNHCGFEVVLECNWANACSNCYTEYNGSGQELAHRSQWGAETGEHFNY